MNTPITYHGTWWFPTESIISPLRQHCKTLTGTLCYYGDKESTLVLVFTPQDYQGVTTTYDYPDVIWGETADGCKITLLNASCVKREGWQSVEYEVEYIVEGTHLSSIEEKVISRAVVRYPNLAQWCFKSRMKIDTLKNEDKRILLDMHSRDYIFDVEVEEGVQCYTMPYLQYHWQGTNITNLNIQMDTILGFQFHALKGIREAFGYIIEFSRFLSLALYGKQSPNSIELYMGQDRQKVNVLFRAQESASLYGKPVIKYEKLAAKIPAILREWHKVYVALAPIVELLFYKGQTSRYDTANFLGLAQGIDGYFKRFVNKRQEDKDIRKYCDAIQKLLTRLKDVEVVNECKIDIEELVDTRNKYTHLTPDGENPKAVEGDELIWLTQKCRILLSCCVLDCIGLTNKEINDCCEHSAIEGILSSIPFL